MVTTDDQGKILSVAYIYAYTGDVYREIVKTPDGGTQYIFTYDVAFVPLDATVDIQTGEIMYNGSRTGVFPLA